MKKILLVLVAVLAMCAMPARAQQNDTISYVVNRAACSYHAEGDQRGRYYMILSFYGAAGTNLPQLQYHIMTLDTLCITREDNDLTAILLIEPDGAQSKSTNGTDGDLTIQFREFDAAKDGFAAYDCSFIAVLEDGRVLKGEYHDVIRFYNADPSRGPLYPYIPTNEPWTPEGFEQTEEVAAPVKVLCNGQVFIVRDGRMYDLCGRVMN